MPGIKKQYPESLRNFTARMMETLKGAYPNFRPSENPEQMRVYAGALERMVVEFGMGRTAAAILKTVDLVPDFCPTPAKIREFVPAIGGQVKTCTVCHPSGFVQVFSGKTDGGNKIEPQAGAVIRCDHADGQSPVTEQFHEGPEYGSNDVKALWKLHKAKRMELGRGLTEHEQDALIDELDKRKANLPRGKRTDGVEHIPTQASR